MEKQKTLGKNYNKRRNLSDLEKFNPHLLLKSPNPSPKPKEFQNRILRTLNEQDTTFIDSEIAKLTFPLESDSFTIQTLSTLKSSIFATQIATTNKIAYYTLKLSKIEKFNYLNSKNEISEKEMKGMTSDEAKEIMDYPKLVEETLNTSFPLIRKSIGSIYNVFVSFIEMIVGETKIDVLRTKEMFEWKEKTSKLSFKYNKSFLEVFEDDYSDDMDKRLNYEDPLKFTLDDIRVLSSIKKLKNVMLRRTLIKQTKKIMIECGMVYDRMMIQFYFMMNRDKARDGICGFGYKNFLTKLKTYLIEYSMKTNLVIMNEIFGKLIQSFLTRIGRNSELKDLIILKFELYGLLFHKNEIIRESKIQKDPELSKIGEETVKSSKNIIRKICLCCVPRKRKKKKNSNKIIQKISEEDEGESVMIQLVGDKLNSVAQVDTNSDHIELMRKREKENLKKVLEKKISKRVYYNNDYLGWQRELFIKLYEERGLNCGNILVNKSMFLGTDNIIYKVERKNFLNLKDKFFITELHKSQNIITSLAVLDTHDLEKIEKKKKRAIFSNEKVSKIVVFATSANDLQMLKIIPKNKNKELRSNESTTDLISKDINQEFKLSLEPIIMKSNKFMRIKTHFKIFNESIYFTSVGYTHEESSRYQKIKEKIGKKTPRTRPKDTTKYCFKIAETEEHLHPVKDEPTDRLLGHRKSRVTTKYVGKVRLSKPADIKQYYFTPECGFNGMIDIGGIVNFTCDSKEKYLYVLTLNGEIHVFGVKNYNHCGLLDLGKFEEDDVDNLGKFDFEMGFHKKKSKKRRTDSSDSGSSREEERRYSGIVIDKNNKYALVSSYCEVDSIVDNNLVAYFTLLSIKGARMKKLDFFSIKIPSINAISSLRGYFLSLFVRKNKLVNCTQLQDLGSKDIEIVDTCYKGNLSYVLFGSKGEVLLVEPKKPVLMEF